MSGTRAKILDAALALFNAQGTDAVSTNHIAEKAGISPGNLYYHFRNKAEIVRALYRQIEAAWADNYALGPTETPDVARLAAMVQGNFAIQARYRFFFLDLSLLLAADAELAAMYRANRARGRDNTLFLITAFADAGVLAPPPSDTAREDLADLLWLVGDFWLVSAAAAGAPLDEATFARGARLFSHLISPYLERTSP